MSDATTTFGATTLGVRPCPGCERLRAENEELRRKLKARDDEAARDRLRARCHPEGPEGGRH